MEQILEILEQDCRVTPDQIATMLDTTPDQVEQAITQFEKDNVILGYRALVNWEKTMKESVNAFIEVRIMPQHGEGYDKVAKEINKIDMVKSVYLMSGAYDLAVIIEGRTLKEVAMFVSQKLAAMDLVLSTATHFVLKKYKDAGVIFKEQGDDDERRVITL